MNQSAEKEAEVPPPPGASVCALAGVGPARAAALARLGVYTLRELARLVPRAVERAPEPTEIAAARSMAGERVRLRAAVSGMDFRRIGRRRSLMRVGLVDASGSIEAVFFNQPWLRDELGLGLEVELEGVVGQGDEPVLGAPRLDTPGRPLPAPGTLIARYPATEGLSEDRVRALAAAAAERVGPALPDPLPAATRARHGLLALGEAVCALHRPADEAEFEAARRRLALEPLLALQAGLLERRRSRRQAGVLQTEDSAAAHARRLSRLPHVPTPGQAQVFEELRADLARPLPMRRLLQGDVGSGKTLCLLYAALALAEVGGQTAFLAPTALLAEQHLASARAWLEGAGLRVALLTGELRARARDRVRANVELGLVDVVFGTHALFSEGVGYQRLGLVAIDEQHRFGVAQRRALVEKGAAAHVLLASATPIPRTLALTLYGDLDTSVLRGLPAGRGRRRTRFVERPRKRALCAFLERHLEADERLYWVLPRIDTSSSGRGAEEAWERIRRGPLARFGVELVHGRVPADERARRLERFRSGESRVVVGTTVLEVGIDVPAATLMVVEGVERLGLAQLHQLRGRVGRGPADAWCLFLGAPPARARCRLLEQTDDGFAIAEADLGARGMGDLAGARQAGDNREGLSGQAQPDLASLLLARDLVSADSQLAAAYAPAAGAADPT